MAMVNSSSSAARTSNSVKLFSVPFETEVVMNRGFLIITPRCTLASHASPRAESPDPFPESDPLAWYASTAAMGSLRGLGGGLGGRESDGESRLQFLARLEIRATACWRRACAAEVLGLGSEWVVNLLSRCCSLVGLHLAIVWKRIIPLPLPFSSSCICSCCS